MRSPRTPEAGITGAKAGKSLGGDDLFLPYAGSPRNRRLTMAMRIDREADALLFLGRHAAAERLAHRALELRGAP
jgi:hypothetical protein